MNMGIIPLQSLTVFLNICHNNTRKFIKCFISSKLAVNNV